MRTHSGHAVRGWCVAISVAALGATATWASPSGAQTCSSPFVLEPVAVYVPPNFVGVSGGDAVMLPTAGRTVSDPAAALMSSIGLHYTHVALAYDTSGDNFVQSTVSLASPPPSSYSTGGAHYCSRVMSIAGLQHLSPGAPAGPEVDYTDVINSAVIYPSMGRSACSAPAQAYEINSFLHNDVVGGSCEKYVADFCGVPVTSADKFQLTGYNPNATAAQNAGDLLNVGLLQIYNFTYPIALGKSTAFPSWEINTFCGGVDATIMAERATNQVVNEARWKWYDLVERTNGQCPGAYTPGMTPAQMYTMSCNDAGCLPVDTSSNRYSQTVTNATFIKDGDNGAATCNTYCAGSQWGTVGTCVAAAITNYPCGNTPGFVSSGELTCQCQNSSGQLFWKHGNNGTVSCNTYCAGSQWPGGTGTCSTSFLPETCSGGPGTLPTGAELSCICQYPSGSITQDLGGAETDHQWSGPNYTTQPMNQTANTDDYCMDSDQSNQSAGTTCPAWEHWQPVEANYGHPYYMNVPDDVENLAMRENKSPKATSIAGGYYVTEYQCVLVE